MNYHSVKLFVLSVFSLGFLLLNSCSEPKDPNVIYVQEYSPNTKSEINVLDVDENQDLVKVWFESEFHIDPKSESVENIISFQPPVKGVTKIVDNRGLAFHPLESFTPSTKYLVNLTTSNITLTTNRSLESFSFVFNTESLKVKYQNLFFQYDTSNPNKRIPKQI